MHLLSPALERASAALRAASSASTGCAARLRCGLQGRPLSLRPPALSSTVISTHTYTHICFQGFHGLFFCARRSYRSSCRLAESKLIARVAFEPPVPGVAPFLFDFDRLRRLFSSIFIIFDFCWMGAGCEASAGEDTRILRCVRLHRWLRSWLLFRALFRETFSFAIVAISLVRIALYDLLVYSFIALR